MKNYLFVFSFLLSCSSYGQSKIEESKNELNGRNHSSRQNSSDGGRPDNSQNSRTNFNGEDVDFWIFVIPRIAFFGFIGNHHSEQHLHNKLTDYPYYNGESGNYENSGFSKNFRLDIEDNLLYSSNTLYDYPLLVPLFKNTYL